MNSLLLSPMEFKKIIDSWAVSTLSGIGVFEDNTKFEEYKEKITGQLRSEYSDKAIEKFLNPVDSRKMESPDRFAIITGPCGDTMEIYLKIAEDKIVDASFQTDGCKPSSAAGGMMVELVKGLMTNEAENFTQQDVLDALGGLPEENVHCALLAVNTLKEALDSRR